MTKEGKLPGKKNRKTHNLGNSQNDPSPDYRSIPLEKLAAGSWSVSWKRGIYSYKLKERFGLNVPENIIKIENLEIGNVGLITVRKAAPRDQTNVTSDDNEFRVSKNDLVIATYGPPFKCAVVDEWVDGCLLSENLVALSLNDTVPPAYVAAYLNSIWGQKEFDKNLTPYKDSRYSRITEHNLKLLEIPLPPNKAAPSVYQWFENLFQYEVTLHWERELHGRIAQAIFQRIGGGVSP